MAFWAVVLGCLAGSTAAAIVPSFYLEGCAWNATDIVVASEGETIDGRLTVLEAWVGSLAPGAALHVPELAVFASEEKRRERWWDPDRAHLTTVTGKRLVLFLKRETKPEDPQWAPAVPYGGMDVSVCWIESGQAYGLVQIMNPGSAELTRLGQTEATIRATTRKLRADKAELARVRALEDVTKRVEAAVPFATSDVSEAALEAIHILRDAGAPAVPSLLALALPDEPTTSQWPALRALGDIGDPSIVAPVVARLEKELVFWAAAGQHLEHGWWNGEGLAGKDRDHYRWHYARVSGPLRVLTEIGAPGSEDVADVVRRTRKLWRENPVLHEIGNGQIVEHCDLALAAIETKSQPPK